MDFLPIQVTTEHWVEFPGRSSLVICFIHGIDSIYVSVSLSQLISLGIYTEKNFFFFGHTMQLPVTPKFLSLSGLSISCLSQNSQWHLYPPPDAPILSLCLTWAHLPWCSFNTRSSLLTCTHPDSPAGTPLCLLLWPLITQASIHLLGEALSDHLHVNRWPSGPPLSLSTPLACLTARVKSSSLVSCSAMTVQPLPTEHLDYPQALR